MIQQKSDYIFDLSRKLFDLSCRFEKRELDFAFYYWRVRAKNRRNYCFVYLGGTFEHAIPIDFSLVARNAMAL